MSQMNLAAELSNRKILTLIVTYQVEGPRIDYALNESKRAGLEPRIALSIRSDDPRTHDLYDADQNRRWRKKPMTSGEIACYWGHREAWKILLETDAEFAIVLEDDFYIESPELLKGIILSLADLPEFDILMLRTHMARGRVKRWQYGSFFVEKRMFGATSATGYFVSRAGAQKFLSREKIYRPIDGDFINPWELDLRIFNVNPEPVSDTSTLVSSLDEQRVRVSVPRIRRLYGVFIKTRWQVLSVFHWFFRNRA